MGYELQGQMQEICTCATYCPCWAGEDPDGGSCRFAWIFHFDSGQINDVDVAGMNMGFLGHLPGNVFKGNVRLKVLVDDRSSEAQQGAMIAAFTGQAGGPLADLASLVGEVVGVERVPIEFDGAKGSGRFRAGEQFAGEVEAYRSPGGAPTAITDTALSPVLGSPVYPGKVTQSKVVDDEHGLAFTANTASQTEFHYVAS
jgi:hypothetical protein